MQETAAQILVRTAQRWYSIRHLDSDTRKRLMAMTEEEFKVEYEKLVKPVA
ncbi:MAG: hypothetical protein KME28_13165 [Pelatocladus maniniholoensis HA4357-MV3]|jgi:hypothetical protein|uniref:Uncharacterized protein n=1 Tax=Pelatocladus maniniholoensis HA4357-MV3 TaxID=1117104 RepID=A0A9E3H8H9_9NOST|nr:hypothetical protein [Pelatocladus maniniholoensis HA4357-MV3]BAZ65546.1 hypothetical protein NIES4106_02850 [Fischerella sp. NIES-4106]